MIVGRKAITIFAVAIMVFANSIGIVILSLNQNSKELSNEISELNQSDSLNPDSFDLPDSQDLDPENKGMDDNIEWGKLPQDQNPSAKIFPENEALGIEYRLSTLDFVDTDDGEVIYADGLNPLFEPGAPMVPELRFFVAVPEGSKIENIVVVEGEPRQLPGYHNITPYLPKTMEGEDVGVIPNPDIYESPDIFPSKLFDYTGPDKLRHLDALEFVIYPVRYRPVLGIVEVYDHMRIRVDLDLENSELPSIPVNDDLDQAVLDLVVNPEDVVYSSNPINNRGTRAPSTIYHTLGFHGDAGSIHPTKDTTVGNGGGAALLHEDDDTYYDAEAGMTLYVDGFDIGFANPTASLEYAMLHGQYKGTNGYDGDSKVRWAKEGQPLSDTTIQPEDLTNDESDDLTYNLLGHAGSPSSVSDIADLDIEFTENGVGSGSKDIPFDYIWIEFAYREELTGDSDYLIITNLAFSDELRPLSEWKTNRLNIDTQVYDTDWIDSNWDGTDLLERTHDFVRSMFENYSIEYVLIGGDENIVPTDSADSSYDSYYADVTGFVYPDIAVGRLPTDLDSEMDGMVVDILSHQRDMGSWKKDVYLIGTNVFNTGDGKRDMEYARDNYLLDLDHTFYEDYEVNGDITRSRTINAYNQGMGLSIITGHGSKYGWYKNNGSQNFFNRNDVDNSMTNSDKRGFVWSSTCSSGGFAQGTMCIGEMWVRARGGGGIGYIGAGEIAYYSSTMWLYRRFYEAYNDMKLAGEDPTQGIAHMKALNKVNYRIYILFGDPQVGLGLTSPVISNDVGSFGSGNFESQMGFDQSEQVSFKVDILYPQSVLPKGVNINFTIRNDNGDTYYLNEIYFDDPQDIDESFFVNWSVPSTAVSGIYNFSINIYNASQNWEFIFQDNAYFFVGYNAKITSVEQVNVEVIEGDTVTYRIHIDDLLEPIPSARIRVDLKGRDFDPFMTPYDYSASKIVTIPSGLDVVVEILITISQPGTYDVKAGLYLDWALMDSLSEDKTEARGIRVLDVSLNYPLYFREDIVNVGYHYFAFSDFPAQASLNSAGQTDQLYDPHDFYNGTGWLNFTWNVPKYLLTGTYSLDLSIDGLGRSLETNTNSMRVVTVREILDLGESWLNSEQETDGGWYQSDWTWPPGTDYNETARAMQAMLWSGVEQSDPVIQNAADNIENNIYLDTVKRVDKLAEVVWALVDAGRGASSTVSESATIIRKMQNWVYEPEIWGLYIEGVANKTWLVNVSGYDVSDNLMYSYEDTGMFEYDYHGFWFNFSVLPDTVTLNFTLKTNNTYFMRQLAYPPFYNRERTAWEGLWINDYNDYGDGILWNRTYSEEFDFDYGWGVQKGIESLAGFTAWAVAGLIQSKASGSYETQATYSGVRWLLDHQLPDGSWSAYVEEDFMGSGGSSEFPGQIVDNWAQDIIQSTAISIIALEMNGTTGLPLDNGVAYLKTRQVADGSYPWLEGSWYYKINLISTAHTLRALRRTDHVFRMDSDFVKEGARWLCAAQDEDLGNWDLEKNFTRVVSEAMLALASLEFQRTIDLEPGWNLISLNLELEDTSLGSVLASISGEYDAVQWYDAADMKDPWKHNEISKPSEMNDLDELDYTRGIWVHITNPAGVTFTFYGSELKRNPQIILHQGWNLVGYPSMSNRDRTLAMNNIDFASDLSIIQWHDPTSDTWYEVGAGDRMEVGKGYWVHSKVDTIWEVPL
jgi:hypothetical protein